MTCKKFWQTKNCLRRECLAGSGRTLHGAPNTQLSRGPPRKQFEGGIDVAEAGLKRLFGNGGVAIEAIKRAHPCVIGVFKKGRAVPLLHVVAFSQHHLDGALRCIKDTLSRPAPRTESIHLHVPQEVIGETSVKREVAMCRHRYEHTTIEFDEETETLTIRGPATQANLARVDILMALPAKVQRTVVGPAGVLIGKCGETVGSVRETFNVDVAINGDSAVISGWETCVNGAVAFYEELFSSYRERRERWAAIKAYKRSTRQCSEVSISSSTDSTTSTSNSLSRAASSSLASSYSREVFVMEWVW